MNADGCKECGGSVVTREDDGGEFGLCVDCGLRQDGLSGLQKRFGGLFGGGSK